MICDRIKFHKTLAQQYKGNNSINELAEMCRASSSFGWVEKPKGTYKTFRDEKRVVIKKPNGCIKAVYYYTTKNDFDDVLFSKLFTLFIPAMMKLQHRYNNLIKEEDFIACMEDSLIYALRVFDLQKSSFSSLYIGLITNRIKKVAHKSYDEINIELLNNEDEDENSNKQVKEQIDERSSLMIGSNLFMNSLKEHYKKQNDIVSWLIVDWHEDEPEISKSKAILETLKLVSPRLNEHALRKVYLTLSNEDSFTDKLGFSIDKTINTIGKFRTLYKKSMNKLREDLTLGATYDKSF